MQSGGAVPRLEGPRLREYAPDRADAQAFQQRGVGTRIERIGRLLGEEQDGLARDNAPGGLGRAGRTGVRLLDGAACEQREQDQQDMELFSHGH